MIEIKADICTDYERSSAREWLETNGIGGFACGTIAGANTRRYHGLLTAATKPPLGRITMLSKFEESVTIDGTETELSANRFGNEIAPRGFEKLVEFRLDPFPIWVFDINGVRIEKKVFMRHGHNTTVCRWTVLDGTGTGKKIELKLRPLLSFADYHSLQHEFPVSERFTEKDGRVAVRLTASDPFLYLFSNADKVVKTGHWYKNFRYSIEQERGFDDREDLFQPFAMTFGLNVPAGVIITLDAEPDEVSPDVLEMAELFRRETLLIDADAKDDMSAQLTLAADQFIAARQDGFTIIAGYPWFSDWGRDTMIALPGLTLATGRPDAARKILTEYAGHISMGMIPNRFPDVGETAEYNTVDATLWFIEAVRAYLAATGDAELVRGELYEQMAGVIAWHVRGTRYGIKLDTDGLLAAGTENSQLTWMDAKYGDTAFTPRIGKPVEVQALWYNALCVMRDLAELFGDHEDRSRYEIMADLCRQSFNGVFWNADAGCLYDVVNGSSRDGSVRPNQILAVSLHHSMVDDERGKAIVEKVQNDLLTPFGLRSLSPADPQYRPIYIGSPYERDSAYHQGTVWAWLIGPFVDAYRRVNGGIENTTADVAGFLEGFARHLSECGIGQISEIFDGDEPHCPRGTFAQAWSVAEVLRVLRENEQAVRSLE